MRAAHTSFSAIILGTTAALCYGQDCAPLTHRDIDFEVQAGKIATGVAILMCPLGAPPDQCAQVNDWGWRVHPRPFQEDPCDPYFADNPGTFAPDGSGLPAGSFVGFDIVGDLLYWDGIGSPQFGPVPSGETLKIKLGGQSRTAGTGAGFVSGFYFAVVDSNGGLHVHLSYFLQGADGNTVPALDVPACGLVGDGVQPTDGLYLLQLQFKSNAGIATSDPVWIVFDNNIGGCMDCEGIVYVGSQIAHDRPAADLDFDRNVDQTDLERFAECFTGPGIAWSDPCCEYADFDHDGDVDMSDFGILQRCYAGPEMPADPHCAE